RTGRVARGGLGRDGDDVPPDGLRLRRQLGRRQDGVGDAQGRSPVRARTPHRRLPTILSPPRRRASAAAVRPRPHYASTAFSLRCSRRGGYAGHGRRTWFLSPPEFPMHLLLLFLAMTWTADGKDDAAKQDLAKMQGTWRVVQ